MKKIRGWKSWSAIVVGFVAVTLGGFRNTAWSEDLPPPANTLSLEQRVNILERKLEVSDENVSAAAKTAAKPSSDKEGFGLKSADGNFAIKFRGLIQADSRWFTDDEASAQTDQFLLRRIRPTLEGTVWKDFDFRITPDFANNSATSLYDAYIDVKTFPVKFRFGKFKPPVGLERLQSAQAILFVERGFPTALVPSRDTGVQLFGELWNGKASYAASFTNGVPDGGTGETDTNDGKEGAARIFLTPFEETVGFFQGLGFGIAGTFANSHQGAATTGLSNYRTPGQIQAFTWATTAVADGEHTRVSPQLYWGWRSLGLLSEYVNSAQVVRRTTNNAKYHISNEAWQAVVSYVLTGEEASFKGVKPNKNFDPKEHGWGAWEVVGRLQRLDLDPEIFTQALASASNSFQRATAWSTGLNWYLNHNLKFVIDYEQTEFDRGATLGDRPTEKVIFTRTQIAF